VVCDSAQIEARIVAWLAGEVELVAAFAKGDDIYSQFASKVYGKPVNKSENKLERHVGKCATLGLGFSMGPDKFQHLLKSGNPSVTVDAAEAQRIVRMYRTTYSRIKRFWTTCDNALFAILKGEKLVFGANGVLETCAEGIRLPNGMMLRYPNLTYQDDQFAYTNDRRQIAAWTTMNLTNNWDLNKLTRVYGGKATENCVQALARIVVMDQLVEISKRYRPVHTVYDDIALCVPDAEAEDAKAFMLEAMSVAPDWAPGLPIACEAAIGKNYADAK